MPHSRRKLWKRRLRRLVTREIEDEAMSKSQCDAIVTLATRLHEKCNRLANRRLEYRDAPGQRKLMKMNFRRASEMDAQSRVIVKRARKCEAKSCIVGTQTMCHPRCIPFSDASAPAWGMSCCRRDMVVA